jgi:hypothetical protein
MDTNTYTPVVEPSLRRQNADREPTLVPGSTTNNITTRENVLQPSGLPSPICFRIRGIPPHWQREDVMEHLTNHVDRDLDWNTARLSGPFPSPFGDRQCALLNLDYCTSYLSTRFSDQNTEKYSVVEVNQKTFHMVIDRHFYDLTPMNKPTLPTVAEYVSLPKDVHMPCPSPNNASNKAWSLSLAWAAMLSALGGVGDEPLVPLNARCGYATFYLKGFQTHA